MMIMIMIVIIMIIIDTQNRFYFIVKRLKNAFLMYMCGCPVNRTFERTNSTQLKKSLASLWSDALGVTVV